MIHLDNQCGKVLVLGGFAHLDAARIDPNLQPIYYDIREYFSNNAQTIDLRLPYRDASFSIVIIGDLTGIENFEAERELLLSEIYRVCCGEILYTLAGRALCPMATGFDAPKCTEIENPVARVLVISNMYPFPGDYVSGVFVYDQVKELREKCRVDARVISGKHLFVGGLNPFNIMHVQSVYGRQMMKNKALLAEGQWQNYGGVPVCYFPWRAGAPLVPHSLYSKSYVRSAMQILDEIWQNFQFNIIHAHTSFLDGNAARVMAEACHVPYVITEHTGPFSTLTKKPWIRTQTFAALRGAAEVWGVSDFQQRTIQAHFRNDPAIQEKIGVLYNGVDTDVFYPREAVTKNDTISVMYIGYLVDIKNIDILIEAFGKVTKKFPHTVLKIVGGGDLEGKLHIQANSSPAADRIKFLGKRDHSEIPSLLRDECDILVLCSQGETFGVVVAEAQACGKPCIVTRCGGPESIITDSSLGETCDVGSVDSLANALHIVLENIHKYDANHLAGHAKKYFGSESIARQLTKRYQTVIKQAHKQEGAEQTV